MPAFRAGCSCPCTLSPQRIRDRRAEHMLRTDAWRCVLEGKSRPRNPATEIWAPLARYQARPLRRRTTSVRTRPERRDHGEAPTLTAGYCGYMGGSKLVLTGTTRDMPFTSHLC